MGRVLRKTAEAVVSGVKALVPRVYLIISHFEMHDDELLARWFLRTFGEELFPGIRSAGLMLVDSGLRWIKDKTGEMWFWLGYLGLGTGEGPLDEHRFPPKEREGTSAATLAANILNIDQYPPVQVMLAHAVRVDRTPTATTFDISSVVKAWHRSGVDINRVCRMYDRIADAWFTVLSGKVRNPSWQERPTFNMLAAEWIINHLAPEGFDRSQKFATAYDAAEVLGFLRIKTLGPLLVYFIKLEQNDIQGTPTVDGLFEMAGTVDALNQDNAPERVIRDIVFTSLQAKWDEQIRFMKACDELAVLNRARDLYVPSCDWSIMRVVSDNPDMNRAARYLDPHRDMFIQRGTDGHLVAWYNQYKFNMDYVIAELRMAELRAAGRRCHLTWEQLVSEGTLPLVPEWYYNPVNGQIMNGSRTNRDKPKSRLGGYTLIWIFVNKAMLRVKETKPEPVPESEPEPRPNPKRKGAVLDPVKEVAAIIEEIGVDGIGVQV